MSEQRLCIVCARVELEPTEPQTCVRCLSRARSAVDEIVELYTDLPAELVDHAGAARPPDAVGAADTDGLPDALVHMAGGGNGSVVSSWRGNRDHAVDQWPTDPVSVLATLATWEDDWRDVAGHGAAGPATVTGSSDYLLSHLTWAAQHHPAFNEFAADARKLRDQLRQVTRSGESTERGVPCPYCGARLIRRYADEQQCGCGPRPMYERWYGHGYDLDIWHAELERWEMRHAYCDQGGRREDWVCSDRECGKVFDQRRYRFAVWVQHYDRQAS